MEQGGMAQGGMLQGGMAQQLTFSRFADLLLARTYEREQREGAMRHFDTRDLMSDLVGIVEGAWMWQAAELLARQGLLDALTSDQGGARVSLTPEGRVFVEQEQSPTIRDYRNSAQIVVVTGDGNQVAVGHGQTVQQSGTFEKEDALELLDELEERLNASDLPDPERADALADVEAIRTQVKKEKPTVAVIKATLSTLSAIALVADIAEKLGGMIH